MSPDAPRDIGRDAAHDEQWEQLAVGHALDALEPEDAAAFATHLPTCAVCGQSVTEMTEVAAEMALAADPVPLPDTLWRGIASAVAASDRPALPGNGVPAQSAQPAQPTEVDLTAIPKMIPGGTRRGSARLRAAALAVAAVVVGLVVLGGIVLGARYLDVRNQKLAAGKQLAAVLTCSEQKTCSVVPLRGTSGASGVALVTGGNQVGLVVRDLKASDRHASYVLWEGGPGGSVRGVGRFAVPGPGPHVVRLTSPLPLPQAAGRLLAVTREPGLTLPTKPTTPILLAGAFT